MKMQNIDNVLDAINYAYESTFLYIRQLKKYIKVFISNDNNNIKVIINRESKSNNKYIFNPKGDLKEIKINYTELIHSYSLFTETEITENEFEFSKWIDLFSALCYVNEQYEIQNINNEWFIFRQSKQLQPINNAYNNISNINEYTETINNDVYYSVYTVDEFYVRFHDYINMTNKLSILFMGPHVLLTMYINDYYVSLDVHYNLYRSFMNTMIDEIEPNLTLKKREIALNRLLDVNYTDVHDNFWKRYLMKILKLERVYKSKDEAGLMLYWTPRKQK